MTNELTGYTPERLNVLAFRLRSSPQWARDEIIREWLTEDQLRASRKTIIDAVDPALVQLLSLTVEPIQAEQ